MRRYDGTLGVITMRMVCGWGPGAGLGTGAWMVSAGGGAGNVEHLDVQACPDTVRLLETLFNAQLRDDPDGLAALGFERTPRGVWVDWNRLADSDLAPGDKAIVRIAHGCAVLERTGGIRPSLGRVLLDTVSAVAKVHDPPPSPPAPLRRHLRVIDPP
jgi:hypothetical protein